MATIGAQDLLSKYGSPLGVAEALLLGKVRSWEQQFVREVVPSIILETARIRLEASGELSKCKTSLVDPELEAYELGQKIGFGRLMQLAQEGWRTLLEKQGAAGGEFAIGTCVAFLVPCVCIEQKTLPKDCDWCCATGQVTKRVREAIKEIEHV
jgi:hypothetical protein